MIRAVGVLALMVLLAACPRNDRRPCTTEGISEPQSGGVVVCKRHEDGQLYWKRKGF